MDGVFNEEGLTRNEGRFDNLGLRGGRDNKEVSSLLCWQIKRLTNVLTYVLTNKHIVLIAMASFQGSRLE